MHSNASQYTSDYDISAGAVSAAPDGSSRSEQNAQPANAVAGAAYAPTTAYSHAHVLAFLALIICAIIATTIAVTTASGASSPVKESPTFDASIESVASKLGVKIKNDKWNSQMDTRLEQNVPMPYAPYVEVTEGVDAYVFMMVEIPCASDDPDSEMISMETYGDWTIVSTDEPYEKQDGQFVKKVVYSFENPVTLEKSTTPLCKSITFLGSPNQIDNITISLQAMSIQAEGFKNKGTAWEAYKHQEEHQEGDGESFDEDLYKDSGDGTHEVVITNTSITLSDNFTLLASDLVPGVAQGGDITMRNEASEHQLAQISIELLWNNQSVTRANIPEEMKTLLDKMKFTVMLNGTESYSGKLDADGGIIDIGVLKPNSSNTMRYAVLLDKYAQDEVIGSKLGMRWSLLSSDYFLPDDPNNPGGAGGTGDSEIKDPNSPGGAGGSENGSTGSDDSSNSGGSAAGSGSGSNGSSDDNVKGDSSVKHPTRTSEPVRETTNITSLSNTGDNTFEIAAVALASAAAALALTVLAICRTRKWETNER